MEAQLPVFFFCQLSLGRHDAVTEKLFHRLGNVLGMFGFEPRGT